MKYPKWIQGPILQLLQGLLTRNVAKRLGAAKGTMFKVGLSPLWAARP